VAFELVEEWNRFEVRLAYNECIQTQRLTLGGVYDGILYSTLHELCIQVPKVKTQ
jgi:hypothetical protein